MNKREVTIALKAWMCRNNNRLVVEGWLDEAFEELASGNGSRMVSGSAGGTSFTLARELSLVDWISVMSEALGHQHQTNTTIGFVRY